MDEQLIFKIVSAIGFLIVPFLIGVIPFVITKIKCKYCKDEHLLLLLDILNAFSGGVLLSVGILHILGRKSILIFS